MAEVALLAVGILLIIASVTLIFLKRPGPTPVIILFFGVVVCLTGTKLGSFTVDLPIFHGRIVTAQVPEATADVVALVAPLQSSIQKIQDALAKQEAFNNSIMSSVKAIQPKVASDHAAIEQPDINATSDAFRANNQYSVFLFYKTPRAKDSQELARGLAAAGFQASAIATSFKEAPQLGPDGSTVIVPTQRGTKIADAVKVIVAKQGLPNVELEEPYPVSRGDIQVFLY